jgi:hypothetical protein
MEASSAPPSATNDEEFDRICDEYIFMLRCIETEVRTGLTPLMAFGLHVTRHDHNLRLRFLHFMASLSGNRPRMYNLAAQLQNAPARVGQSLENMLISLDFDEEALLRVLRAPKHEQDALYERLCAEKRAIKNLLG